MKITALQKKHYPAVADIYKQGMDTGVATFETNVPNWDAWNKKFLANCRFVAILDGRVIGWCALSPVSKRLVYAGVAEDTIYIAEEFQGSGFGKLLLHHLIEESEAAGIYMMQASIFPENKSSIRLHEQCGFRVVGLREKIGQRHGKWFDNVLMERRSKKHLETLNKNPMDKKNILVLCTGNSCRSQMAHGYLKQMAGEKATIYSAGIETHGLNAGAVSIMAEDNIDISNHTSNHVDEYKDIAWDYIITVCDHAHENCPFIPAPKAKRLHHNFFDPSKVEGSQEKVHAAFLKARNEIRDYCRSFIETNL